MNDKKAAYRFFDNSKVTKENIKNDREINCLKNIQSSDEHILIIQNTSDYRQFYITFPEIFAIPWRILSWSHYKRIMQVDKDEARAWYLKEVAEQMWSYRALDRNIGSQYYERLLLSHNKERVETEMKSLTRPFEQDRLEFIKNPTVAEFIGLSPNIDFTESDLESAIIGNLQRFLLELGKGWSFVARQKLIRTEKKDYYIDLVFYNYLLKNFVLIDLKTTPLSHQDVGQMDMYVRIYNERVCVEGDNPTIGIVLCSETDDDIARYSVLHDNNQLFASKLCFICLPKRSFVMKSNGKRIFTFCKTQKNRTNHTQG